MEVKIKKKPVFLISEFNVNKLWIDNGIELNPPTVKFYTQMLRKFNSLIEYPRDIPKGIISLDDLDKDILDEFYVNLILEKKQKATLNKYLTFLRQFFRNLKREDIEDLV